LVLHKTSPEGKSGTIANRAISPATEHMNFLILYAAAIAENGLIQEDWQH
jgi:hypothetical protein